MWNETNFLLKGFINEVKGALTESGGASGVGVDISTRSNGITKMVLFHGDVTSVPALNIKAAFASAVDQ